MNQSAEHEAEKQRLDWIAQDIAKNRKAYRAIAQGWCPSCGKFVAGIFASSSGLILFLQGGRSGSHAEMVAEYERSLEDALYSQREARAFGRSDLEANAAEVAGEFRQMLEMIRESRFPAMTPPTAYALDGRRTQYRAACRGCRHDVTVEVESPRRVVVHA